MMELFLNVCTVTGAIVWVAFIVGLIAWTAGIADFGLDIEKEDPSEEGK